VVERARDRGGKSSKGAENPCSAPPLYEVVGPRTCGDYPYERPTRQRVSRRGYGLEHVADQKDVMMIEWVPYSGHKIKACSQSLEETRWLPLVLIWKSVENQELLKTVWGESTEICKSSKEADSVALRKAKRWIDQNR
jgi:hypothetical protein